MPTFNDTLQRPLKYVTGTAAFADITSGVSVRVHSIVVTLNGAATVGSLHFHAQPTADINERQNMSVTEEFPTAIKSWAPQGLTGTGLNTNTVVDCIWTIAYQETEE